MNKIIGSAALLGLFSYTSYAQQAKEKQPATYKIEAQQKINANIYQLVYNTGNNSVYVVGPKGSYETKDDQYVYELDGNTLAVKDSIVIGKYAPFGLAINNKTQTLYIGHSVQQRISALDLKTKKVTVIPSGREKSKIRELFVDEQNNRVYVSDHGDPSLWVIDGKTNKYLKTIGAAYTYPLGLNVDAKRGKIYATDGASMEGNVLVFDLKTNTLLSKWKTWAQLPLNIAIDHQKNRLFISMSTDDNVTVVDGNSGNIINKIYLGKNAAPVGLVYDESQNLIYVANRGTKEVAVVDAENYKVKERIATKGLPNTITINKSTGAIYVTNKASTKADKDVENGDTVQKIVKI